MRASVFPIGILILSSAFFINSCGDKSNEELKEMKENQSSAYSDEEKATEEILSQISEGQLFENREPVPPVSFKVLMNYLPKEVAGLKSEKPRGESVQWDKWIHSNASVTFNSQTGEQSAGVNIYDYAYINDLYLPYQMLFKMKYNRESSEGYERSSEINGHPTFERWNEEGKDNEVTALVGNRFIVHVKTNGMEDGSARKIIETMNLNSLAKESSK